MGKGGERGGGGRGGRGGGGRRRGGGGRHVSKGVRRRTGQAGQAMQGAHLRQQRLELLRDGGQTHAGQSGGRVVLAAAACFRVQSGGPRGSRASAELGRLNLRKQGRGLF